MIFVFSLYPFALAQDAFVPSFRDPEARIEAPANPVETLQFLTTDDFPPFNYVTPAGELAGFHVDLARSLCDILSIRCSIQVRPWETLIDAATQQDNAAIIAGIAATSETRDSLFFTARYLTTPARFVARKTDAGALDVPDLTGKTVGVVEGSAHERYITDLWPGVERLQFASVAGAQEGLKSGVVDYVFGDAIALAFWLNGAGSEECCRFASGPFEDDRYFGEGLRIAVPVNNADLAAMLDFALDRAQRDGSYREIYLRHFPIGIY